MIKIWNSLTQGCGAVYFFRLPTPTPDSNSGSPVFFDFYSWLWLQEFSFFNCDSRLLLRALSFFESDSRLRYRRSSFFDSDFRLQQWEIDFFGFDFWLQLRCSSFFDSVSRLRIRSLSFFDRNSRLRLDFFDSFRLPTLTPTGHPRCKPFLCWTKCFIVIVMQFLNHYWFLVRKHDKVHQRWNRFCW